MSKPANSYPMCVKFSWIFLVQMLLLCATEIAASTPTAEHIIAMLKLSQNKIADLERGKIVTFKMSKTTQKELAIGLGMYLPSSPAKLAAFFKRGDFATIDPDVYALGEILPQSGIDAFKRFAFTLKQRDEVRNLLAAVPGDQFNLSAEEINSFAPLREKLADADEATLVASVSQHYQQILVQRWQAYRKQGLAGIASYARHRANASPAEELRLAAADSKLLARLSPALQQVWLNYPAPLPPGAEERFFWLNREVEKRPTAILSHRILLASEAGPLIVTRQFFVGHSYNSSYLMVGCLPYRDGSIVFYTHRTSTDQITGLGSRLKRNLGRERIKKQMMMNLKGLRAAVESF